MTTRPGAIRYAGMLMVVIPLALTLKIFVLDAVYVPGRSMEPAVLPGDFLVLDKTGYAPAALAFRTPGRGEVVAFTLPGGDGGSADAAGSLILKRCVATAVDMVAFRGGGLLVNGRATVPGIADRGPFFADDLPRPVPRKGDSIPLDSAHCALWRDFIVREGHSLGYAETGGMVLDGAPADSYTVEQDYIFVMGDNHGVSLDSRTWGFIPSDRVVGTALMIYWSLGDGGGVRWDRIGTLVD